MIAHTWAILEIRGRLFSWSMMDGESGWRFTLGHTPLISDGFSEVMWSTLGHTLLIDDRFLSWWPILRHSFLIDDGLLGWRPTLGHSQFSSSLGLWWIRSWGMTLHWSITISESTFIGDIVTLLNILHWDTLHSLMVAFSDDGSFWYTIASEIAHVKT